MSTQRVLLSFSFLVAVATLGSCSYLGTSSDDAMMSSSSSQDAYEETAPEVTYEGTLENLDPRFSLEGTHRLSLGGGTYLLLESDAEDLDAYQGETVRVTGVVRSAMNDDALIMRVSRVETMLLGSPESSSSSEAEEVTFLSSASSAPAEEEAPVPPRSQSSSRAPAPAAASSSVATQAPSAEGTSSRAAAMQNTASDPSRWTQRYCSSHIGFCIPIHKNWWYKSFGVTASSLWHLELSDAEIQNMGEGLVVVTFESGTLPAGISDGAVVDAADGMVTGYKAWTGQRHFEVTAPATLRSSVEYIVANFSTYEAPVEE